MLSLLSKCGNRRTSRDKTKQALMVLTVVAHSTMHNSHTGPTRLLSLPYLAFELREGHLLQYIPGTVEYIGTQRTLRVAD